MRERGSLSGLLKFYKFFVKKVVFVFFLAFFSFNILAVDIVSSELCLFESSGVAYSDLQINVPSGWIVYSDKKSSNGKPMKVVLNNESEKVLSIHVFFPSSIEEDGDFFYSGEQKIHIVFGLKNKSEILDKNKDFLLFDYVMCNKKTGECVNNNQRIYLSMKN